MFFFLSLWLISEHRKKLFEQKTNKVLEAQKKEIEDKNVLLKQQNDEIITQNKEITTQRDALSQANEEIKQQNEEITAQRDALSEANEEIKQQNEEITTQRDEIEAQRDEITNQRDMLQKIYQEVKDSIKYAQRIQKAILPPRDKVEKMLPESFVIFQPKDIVSGDFYRCQEVDELTFFASIDCTGHGVPGAFLSFVGNAILHDAIQK